MSFSKTILIGIIISIATAAMAQEQSGNAPVEPSKQVKLFPNPAIEFLTVRFETPQAKQAKFALYNIIGNELEVESEVIDDFETKVKVKDLPIGFYLLRISNDGSGFKGVYKFLKK